MNLSNDVQYLLNELKSSGFEAFVVGGCVRDMIMDIPPHDYDITTNATPIQIQQVFQHLRTIPTGIQHGTITVLYNHEAYEITTYRHDVSYSDHRHPDEVSFSSLLEDDLLRRDFTMNAIAYNPDRNIVDLYNGYQDIENRIIRCVGDPNRRFNEDGLRILRALRFSSVLGFTIEQNTAHSIIQNRELLTYISVERCFAELCKLLCGENVKDVLMLYRDVLTVVIPELKRLTNEQYEITVNVLSKCPPDIYLRLVALFHQFHNPEKYSRDVLLRLHSDLKTQQIVSSCLIHLDTIVSPSIPAVRKALFEMGKTTFEYICVFHGRDDLLAIMDDIESRHLCYNLRQLAVNGNDISKMGYHGKEIGNVLHQCLMAVMNDTVQNKKEDIIAFLQSQN